MAQAALSVTFVALDWHQGMGVRSTFRKRKAILSATGMIRIAPKGVLR